MSAVMPVAVAFSQVGPTWVTVERVLVRRGAVRAMPAPAVPVMSCELNKIAWQCFREVLTVVAEEGDAEEELGLEGGEGGEGEVGDCGLEGEGGYVGLGAGGWAG